MIGLDLADLAVDGSITKSPCGGEVSGHSPVDRGKQGTKRSVACDGAGIPLHLNDHDSPPLGPTLAGICDMIGPLPDQPCVHLDRGYDSAKTRDLLEILGYDADIVVKGTPAPIQAGKRCLILLFIGASDPCGLHLGGRWARSAREAVATRHIPYESGNPLGGFVISAVSM
jgi:hypothetical protein